MSLQMFYSLTFGLEERLYSWKPLTEIFAHTSNNIVAYVYERTRAANCNSFYVIYNMQGTNESTISITLGLSFSI